MKDYWLKFKNFANECKRVLKVTKKPDKNEFSTIVKMSALGMSIIGIAGFIVFLINKTIFG